MKPNTVKRKILRDEVAVGIIMLSADPHVVGISAAEGYDYVLADLEHTGATLRDVELVVRAADAAGIIPMVRVPGPTKADILSSLEVGVRGIMVPAVETVDEARMVVEASRYAPQGRRGVYYMSYSSGYAGISPSEHFASSNEELLIMLQIETARGVENAAAIAAVPGVDCLFIGPGDLSQSLGVTWEFEHPRLWEAIRSTFQAARAHGKVAGIMPAGADYGRRCVEEGARLFLWGPDLGMYQRAAREDAAALRQAWGWQGAAGC